MALTTGFLQHLDVGAAGGSPSVTMKITGGNWRHLTGVDFDLSLGGTANARYGMIEASGSGTFLPAGTAAATILNYGLRTTTTAAGVTALVLQGGDSTRAFKMDYAYFNRVSLSGRVGGTLEASFDWIARQPSAIAVPTWTAYDSGTTYQWFQAATNTLDGGTTLAMQSFELSIENGLRAETNLDSGKSTNEKRWPAEVCIGTERVTGNFTVGVPPGSNRLQQAWYDAPDGTVAFAATFTNAAPNTLTIAVANLTLGEWSQPFEGSDGTAWYTINYVGKPNTANTVAISAA